jgi:hypothetical protein
MDSEEREVFDKSYALIALQEIGIELLEKLCNEDDIIECLSFNHPQLAMDILKFNDLYRKEIINNG